ncbi:hypothetical protein BaRGS_00002512 [Batillaria attramentaria]|uniref:Uncharacterized protein n=1 Tax=Batillaria attramentaria TaxID=370345 RepID=A0ABD0M4H4_9CAEN
MYTADGGVGVTGSGAGHGVAMLGVANAGTFRASLLLAQARTQAGDLLNSCAGHPVNPVLTTFGAADAVAQADRTENLDRAMDLV